MEVLKLYIHVNGCEKVESECATVQMISFDGRCDGDYFRGEILPGGVDTQIYYKDQPSKLSARYLVQGIDHTGRGCRIFIENNGIMYDGETITRPVIYTDSIALKWMETESRFIRIRIKIVEKGAQHEIYHRTECVFRGFEDRRKSCT